MNILDGLDVKLITLIPFLVSWPIIIFWMFGPRKAPVVGHGVGIGPGVRVIMARAVLLWCGASYSSWFGYRERTNFLKTGCLADLATSGG